MGCVRKHQLGAYAEGYVARHTGLRSSWRAGAGGELAEVAGGQGGVSAAAGARGEESASAALHRA